MRQAASYPSNTFEFQNIREQQQQKQAEKDQEKQEIMDELRTAYSNIMVARNETKEKERQQINDLMNKLKEKWDQKQEEAAEEKKQEIVVFLGVFSLNFMAFRTLKMLWTR